MKILCLICFTCLHVNARPQFDAFLIDYRSNITEKGYDFGFHTSDGIKRSEAGQLIPNKEESILHIKGDYSYHSPDGALVSVDYSSGANGYVAKSMIINKGATISYASPAVPLAKRIQSAAIASLAGGGLG